MALAMGSATTQAATFNQTYFFGDSQTDTGYFGKITNQINSPSGKFVTNPDKVWAEHVADYYGTSAKSISNNGTNYAAGGALAGDDTTRADLGNVTIPATTTQVTNYLKSTGGKANPNALYAMTSGANNLLAAQQTLTSKQFTSTEAMQAELQTILGKAAKQTAGAVNALHNAGAKYVMVANVADVGLSPLARAGGASLQQAATQATTGYNTLLTGELSVSKANVIPLDTFNLMREVAANPSEYGLKNVVAPACGATSALMCNQKTLVAPNANKDYFFADGLHPTGAGHALVADYALSVLEAPKQIGRMAQNLAQQGSQATLQLHRQIDALPENSSSAWIQAGGEKNRNDLGNNKTTPYVSAGVGFGEQSGKLGVHLRSGKQEQNGQNSSYETKIAGGGAFYRQDFGKIRMTGTLDYDRYSVKTERRIKLGTATRVHQAQSDGLRLGASLRGAYRIDPNENWSLVPYVGVNTQRVEINALNEDKPELSTSMTFGKMKHKSVNGEVGMNANWQVAPNTTLSGSLNFSRNFAKSTEQMSARLRSVSLLEFNLPAAEQLGKNTASAALGVRHLIGNTSLTAGVSGYRGSQNTKGANVFVGVNRNF